MPLLASSCVWSSGLRRSQRSPHLRHNFAIAFVTARAGQDCSEFYVYLTAVFVLDDGQWAPLTTDRVPAIPEILINSGDTLPTIVGIAPYDGWPRVLTEESQRSYQVASEVRSVEQGCRC